MSYTEIPIGNREVMRVYLPNNAVDAFHHEGAPLKSFLEFMTIDNKIEEPDKFWVKRSIENTCGSIARLLETLRADFNHVAKTAEVQPNIDKMKRELKQAGFDFISDEMTVPGITIHPFWGLLGYAAEDTVDEPAPGSLAALGPQPSVITFYDPARGHIVFDGQKRWNKHTDDFATRVGRNRPTKNTDVVSSVYIQSMVHKLKPLWFTSEHAETRAAVTAISNSIAVLSLLRDHTFVKMFFDEAIARGEDSINAQTPLGEMAEYVARHCFEGHSPLTQIHDTHDRAFLDQHGLLGDINAEASLFVGAIHQLWVMIASRDEQKHGHKHAPYERFTIAAQEIMVALMQAMVFAQEDTTSYEEISANIFKYINPQYTKDTDLQEYIKAFTNKGIVPLGSEVMSGLAPTQNVALVDHSLLPKWGLITCNSELIEDLTAQRTAKLASQRTRSMLPAMESAKEQGNATTGAKAEQILKPSTKLRSSLV